VTSIEDSCRDTANRFDNMSNAGSDVNRDSHESFPGGGGLGRMLSALICICRHAESDIENQRTLLHYSTRGRFAHANFGAVALEGYFVHQLIQEVEDTAAKGREGGYR
jgi:hypothetical protein